MRRVILISLLVVACALAIYFVRLSALEKEKEQRLEEELKASATDAIPVEVAEVTTGDIERVLKYTGVAEAKEEVDIFPKVAGRLIELRVDEGDRVSKDETIAIIDPEVTGVRFEPYEVTSPIGGKIAITYLDPGSLVNQATPIARVIDDRIIKVRFSVIERDFGVVRKGMRVRLTFDALPDRVFNAKVTNLSPIVDAQSGTGIVEVELPNARGEVKPGMFVRGEIVVEVHKGAVLMPRAATLKEIVIRGRKEIETVVYVVEGNVARQRKVKLGLSTPTDFEVLEGLRPGEKVVVLGQNLLREGSRVTVVGTQK